MRNNASFFSFISSGLLLAASATVFAQDQPDAIGTISSGVAGPCGPGTSFGLPADAVIFSESGPASQLPGSLYVACVGVDDAGNVIRPIPTFLAGVVGSAVSQNLSSGNYGFISVAAGSITTFGWKQYLGFAQTGGGSFASIGGFAELTSMGLSIRSPGVTNELSFPSDTEFNQKRIAPGALNSYRGTVNVGGFIFGVQNGILVQVGTNQFAQSDFSLPVAARYWPAADIVPYGNGPFVNEWVNSSVFYVSTPNVGGPNTGQVLAVRVDGQGNITTKLLAIRKDMPLDGISRLTVGNQGVYFGNEDIEMVLGFHTVLPFSLSIQPPQVGVSYGALAVLRVSPGLGTDSATGVPTGTLQ